MSTRIFHAALALAAILGGCTTFETTPRDPLDAAEWRSTKSRMYQDLALQCLRAGDHDRARRLLQQAVQFDSKDHSTLELLARLAQAQGDLDTATQAAKLLQESEPQSIAALCTLGGVAEARNQYDEADALYRRAMAIAPGDERPAIHLHRLLLTRARDADADALRAQLAARFPSAIEANLDHGAHLAASGQWTSAAAAYQAALAVRPEDASAATGFALSTVMDRRPNEALELGKRLPPHVRTEHPSLALTMAIAHLRAGDCPSALRELDLLGSAARGTPALRMLRGEILLESAHLEAAQVEFEAALLVAPSTARAHAGVGRVHLARGKPHAAARAFELAVQFDPDNAVSQVLFAISLARSGDLSRAARHVGIARQSPEALPLIEELIRQHPDLAATGGEERR